MRDKGWLSRNGGYIVFFCIFLIFMQTGLYASQNYHASVPSQSSQTTTSWTSMFSHDKPKPGIQHPIPKLMNDAEAEFRRKVGRQSKTLEAAVAEYKRRYKMPPPRDFDRWWQFAKENSAVMVDEYDGLMGDLAPFHQLPGEEIRRRTLQVGTLPSINIVRVRNGEATTVNLNEGFKDSEVSARAHGFRKMLNRFVHTLPDIDFPINTKAEGRVIIPWEHQAYPDMTQQNSSEGIESLLGGPFIADWRGDGNVWNAWRRTCEPGSPARRLFSSVRNVFAQQPHNFIRPSSSISSLSSDFVFAKNTSYSIDFCQHPHAHFSQGHFFSDWRTIPALYPVFSPARARGFMDIKIPSHYYWGSTKRYTYGWDPVNLQLKDVDDMEVPWEDKIDKIFWRGATTGGGSNPRGFTPQYQRHRFLRMSSQDGKDSSTRTVVFADPPTSENYIAAEVNVGELNEEIMDTAFVKATSPETYPGGLKALMKDHRFGDLVPLGRHWAYKYLLDLDGMSYSGRFLAFLASDSVPIKNTVYDEFFSDWIQPWVHFIPLSTTYQEIYNIYAYFSGAPRAAFKAVNSTELLLSEEEQSHRVFDGQNRARRIARAGKQWKKTIGRTVDMEVYVYRLALEYARLWADDREAWVYDP
uniref:Putative capsular associated protein n=1 Tax=Moniliophthora roreri TaxID=221103 RepID=A0A0W0F2S7_MONRR